MRAELRDALSALADGEVADPELVAEALLEPDAAALIVTLAEARVCLRDTSSEPGDTFSIRVERSLEAAGRTRLVLVRRLAPAICAGLGLTAGVIVGVLLSPVGPLLPPTIPGAPLASVVATTRIPAPAPAPAVVAPAATNRKVPPPPARSVYRFEVGRNWREGS